MNYSDKLKDPRWQKKRLEIFERDGWACRWCNTKDQTLAIHHLCYDSFDPWEAKNERLITLCVTCHDKEYEFRARIENALFNLMRLRGIKTDHLFELMKIFRQITDIKKADKFMEALIKFGQEYDHE